MRFYSDFLASVLTQTHTLRRPQDNFTATKPSDGAQRLFRTRKSITAVWYRFGRISLRAKVHRISRKWVSPTFCGRDRSMIRYSEIFSRCLAIVVVSSELHRQKGLKSTFANSQYRYVGDISRCPAAAPQSLWGMSRSETFVRCGYCDLFGKPHLDSHHFDEERTCILKHSCTLMNRKVLRSTSIVMNILSSFLKLTNSWAMTI